MSQKPQKDAVKPSLGRKTGPSFKLSKSTKRIMAFLKGSAKNDFKNLMIDAEVAAIEAKLRSRRPKEDAE